VNQNPATAREHRASRLRGYLMGAALTGALLSAVSRADGPAAARAAGALQQQEAQGWLQLERDQREARRQAEPMTVPQSQRLQIREQQESMQLRQTVQEQQRALDTLDQARRRATATDAPAPAADARAFGQAQGDRQALDTLRLRQDMQRLIEGTPPGRAVLP